MKLGNIFRWVLLFPGVMFVLNIFTSGIGVFTLITWPDAFELPEVNRKVMLLWIFSFFIGGYISTWSAYKIAPKGKLIVTTIYAVLLSIHLIGYTIIIHTLNHMVKTVDLDPVNWYFIFAGVGCSIASILFTYKQRKKGEQKITTDDTDMMASN